MLTVLSAGALGGTLGGVLGCRTDSSFAPAADPNTLFWALRLDQHAVQLSLTAPVNTIQLTATSYTPFGTEWTPVAGDTAPATQWYSTDSSKVLVSSTGLVTAKAVTTSAIRVIAIRRIHNVTQADTSQVRVVDEPTPRTLQSVSIAPTDSAKVAMTVNKPVTVHATDTNGNLMNGVVAYVTVSDTMIAKPQIAWSSGTTTTTVTIQGRQPGTTLVTAVASVYGVVKTDTFTLTVGYAITGNVIISDQRQSNGSFSWVGYNLTQTVGPGAIISWTNRTAMDSGAVGQPIDVIFDTPDGVAAALPDNTHPNPGSGNMTAIPADTGATDTPTRIRYRRFLTPGTYPFHIPQYNISGTVIVKPQ